jgi:hypothetical protein
LEIEKLLSYDLYTCSSSTDTCNKCPSQSLQYCITNGVLCGGEVTQGIFCILPYNMHGSELSKMI